MYSNTKIIASRSGSNTSVTRKTMEDKIEKTVTRTVDALARIERFLEKYGTSLNADQVGRISSKLRELQNTMKV